MKKMNVVKKYGSFKSRAAAAFAAVGASASTAVMAVDDATVTAAQTAGEASVLNATTGLIAIIAVVVGVSLVIALLKRA